MSSAPRIMHQNARKRHQTPLVAIQILIEGIHRWAIGGGRLEKEVYHAKAEF